MSLFTAAQVNQINQIAEKTKAVLEPPKPAKSANSINSTLNDMMAQVVEYFKDSESILIETPEQLHEYVTAAIESGYAGIDTETTGLDRINDSIVGWSLYYPGGVECYIPCKHLIPIFEQPYKHQLTYEECQVELQRLVDAKTKLILANADYDIAMIYKDFKVDISAVTYYDVILAWRCLKENELRNDLKSLYMKYVKKGQGDPKRFSDFFDPKMFPYCDPKVAKLYAANDAKITYELFVWQLPYITKTHPKCQKAHLEKIADLIWNIEFPMIRVCAMLHRVGVELDFDIANTLHDRYVNKLDDANHELAQLIQTLIAQRDTTNNSKRPFRTGSDFNPNSAPHVKYLINNLLGMTATSTGREILEEINRPETNSVLKVRGLVKLIGTYVDKLPKAVGKDKRIHASFKSVGAATGRMASADPNMQNIPSHATDIRHMFRATSEKEYKVNPTNDNGNLSIVLDNGHQVYTPDGLKFVSEVAVGDFIFYEDNDGSEKTLELTTINRLGIHTEIELK